MSDLSPEVYARIAEEARYLSALPGYEAAAWIITDPRGAYQATWGVTAYRRDGLALLTDDLVNSVYAENGGRPGQIIVMHNHPGQAGEQVLPSAADIRAMENLDRKLPQHGIELRDFIIVSDRGLPFCWRDCQLDGTWPRIREAVLAWTPGRPTCATR